MSQILETVMLVCFGLSWPVNLIKSIKAKTARATSLKFIILIILGYIAGIAAKIVSGQFNYVLAAYFVNLVFVAANLCVYFINRKYDKNTKTDA
jgi:archaellum biogenesis protein FlaJ (TadC family)